MFVKLYAKEMYDVDYHQIFLFLTKYINKNDDILDAGMGPGYLLKEFLINDYLNIIGVDNDEAMINYAYNELNLYGKAFIHDLNEEINVKFDAVISVFDVVNYFQDFTLFFKNVYNALNKDGVFIFDVYSYETFNKMNDYKEEFADYSWQVKTDGNEINHLISNKGEEIKIKQYYFPVDVYIQKLNKLGFITSVVEGPDIRKAYIIAKKETE